MRRRREPSNQLKRRLAQRREVAVAIGEAWVVWFVAMRAEYGRAGPKRPEGVKPLTYSQTVSPAGVTSKMRPSALDDQGAAVRDRILRGAGRSTLLSCIDRRWGMSEKRFATLSSEQ